MAFTLVQARSPAELAAAAALFGAYAASIGIDLSYQGFAAELAALPGKYAPPQGELLLAYDAAETPVGCVALRPFAQGCCEMKRLYVAPEGRGLGVGHALVTAIVHAAESAGYREMRLDTLPTMTAAIALYRNAGFVPIPAYYDTPIAGTLFFSRVL